jgi:hypothetical protein
MVDAAAGLFRGEGKRLIADAIKRDDQPPIGARTA